MHPLGIKILSLRLFDPFLACFVLFYSVFLVLFLFMDLPTFVFMNNHASINTNSISYEKETIIGNVKVLSLL